MWYNKFLKESQIGTQQPSLFFDPWAEGAEIKDEKGNAKKLYHGTLNEFNAFDMSKGNPDNYFGKNVIYTTDSPSDVNRNYADELGPDLGAKIDQTSDRLISRLEDEPEYAQQVGINPEDYPNSTELYKVIEPLVREQLGLKYPKVLPLYGKMKNPAIVIPNQPATYFPGEWDEDDNYIPGNADDIFQEITDLAYEFGVNDRNIRGYVADIQDALGYDGFNAYDLNRAIRDSNMYGDIEDEEGNMAGQEFIKQLFQRLGHDGIILDAHQTFRNMEGVNPGDKHYMFFEPTQLKSSLGNQGTYDPSSSVITSSERGWYRFAVDLMEELDPSIRGDVRTLEELNPDKFEDRWKKLEDKAEYKVQREKDYEPPSYLDSISPPDVAQYVATQINADGLKYLSEQRDKKQKRPELSELQHVMTNSAEKALQVVYSNNEQLTGKLDSILSESLSVAFDFPGMKLEEYNLSKYTSDLWQVFRFIFSMKLINSGIFSDKTQKYYPHTTDAMYDFTPSDQDRMWQKTGLI